MREDDLLRRDRRRASDLRAIRRERRLSGQVVQPMRVEPGPDYPDAGEVTGAFVYRARAARVSFAEAEGEPVATAVVPSAPYSYVLALGGARATDTLLAYQVHGRWVAEFGGPVSEEPPCALADLRVHLYCGGFGGTADLPSGLVEVREAADPAGSGALIDTLDVVDGWAILDVRDLIPIDVDLVVSADGFYTQTLGPYALSCEVVTVAVTMKPTERTLSYRFTNCPCTHDTLGSISPPLPGVQVDFCCSGGSATSDSNGEIELTVPLDEDGKLPDGTPAGFASVTITYPGDCWLNNPVVVAVGESISASEPGSLPCSLWSLSHGYATPSPKLNCTCNGGLGVPKRLRMSYSDQWVAGQVLTPAGVIGGSGSSDVGSSYSFSHTQSMFCEDCVDLFGGHADVPLTDSATVDATVNVAVFPGGDCTTLRVRITWVVRISEVYEDCDAYVSGDPPIGHRFTRNDLGLGECDGTSALQFFQTEVEVPILDDCGNFAVVGATPDTSATFPFWDAPEYPTCSITTLPCD